MKIFGSRIQSELKAKGRTQKEFAAYLGVNQASVSKALRRNTTEEKYAMRMAEFLQVPLGEIAALDSGGNPDDIKSVKVMRLEKVLKEKDAELDKLNFEIEHLKRRVGELESTNKILTEVLGSITSSRK